MLEFDIFKKQNAKETNEKLTTSTQSQKDYIGKVY